MFRKLNNKQAFTLVEITVTTGIILLIAAISIFSFKRIRINVNNAAVLGNVRTIAFAIDTYHMSCKNCAVTVRMLAAANPPYISDAFADNRHQGYFYSTRGTGVSDPIVFATPEHYGVTGTKFVIHRNKEITVFDDYYAAMDSMTGGLGGD